jgi:hypothetical protein
MSSVLRGTKEPSNLKRQFAVFGYEGYGTNLYYFTVEGNKLFRIEADLSGVNYIIARDMGVQRAIDSIDSEIIELWETNNSWSNIRVVRPGIARKFQAITMVRGDDFHGVGNGNSAAYIDQASAIYNRTGINMPINDMLIAGHDSTTISNLYTQNLPYGTFWAMNDPLVIEYEYDSAGVETYRRAIKHRIMENTLF